MADETTQQTITTEPTSGEPQATEPAEKTVSKELFDKKISDMNAIIKKLKSEAAEKMTDEEKRKSEYEEMQSQLAEANKAVLSYKTKSQLSQLGIATESVDTLTEAITGNDTEAIISAFSNIIETVRKDAAAAAKKEALSGSFPSNVGADNTNKEKSDAEKLKSIVTGAVSATTADRKNSKYFD